MKTFRRLSGALLVAASLSLAACGDEVDEAANRAEDAAERAKDEVADEAADVREKAEDAFASFRTDFERSIDEASSGDAEAKERILADCRDHLEELRKADDPRAEQVGALCQKMRDADDGNAWKEIREEYDQIRD